MNAIPRVDGGHDLNVAVRPGRRVRRRATISVSATDDSVDSASTGKLSCVLVDAWKPSREDSILDLHDAAEHLNRRVTRRHDQCQFASRALGEVNAGRLTLIQEASGSNVMPQQVSI